MQPFQPIDRVLIAGGTHGNELIGVYLAKYWQRHPQLVSRSSFETKVLLSNPAAFAQRRRYVDRDLNRAFHPSDLQDQTRSEYESVRAREIAQQFGATGATPINMLIDLHSTTANMGLTIIVDEHPFNLRLAAYLNSINSEIRIYCIKGAEQESNSLPSICRFRCTIEVGAVAQGVLDAKRFQETAAIVQLILNYLEQYNHNQLLPLSTWITLYKHLTQIDYPKDADGELTAMIHPLLQFCDYQALHPGHPLFLSFAGETIAYSGETTVYPVFINEAAYYEKGIALCLTQRQVVQADDLKLKIQPEE